MIIVGIILILLGASFLFKPEWNWYISESWKSGAGNEPSEVYIFIIRAAGIFSLGLGVFLIFGSIFLTKYL